MRGVEQKTTLELKLEKLRAICEKAPEHAIGLLALAETAFRRGLRLEALEAYQKVLKDESVAEAHLCMAQMYRHHGLIQESIGELRNLFEMEPSYPEAHIFARELAKDIALPEDIEGILQSGCGQDELSLARVRLSIARSLVLREGQELVAIQDSNAGTPTFGYYIGETRKRLIHCDETLAQLSVLDDIRRTYTAEIERNRQIERERQRAAEQTEVDVVQSSEVSLVNDDTAMLAVTAEADVVQVAFDEQVFEDQVEDPAIDPLELVDTVEEVTTYESEEAVAQVEQDFIVDESVNLDPVEELEGADYPVQASESPLWDDHPVYVPPVYEVSEVALHTYTDPVDLALDLTPTLEGNLPEIHEQVSVSIAWDDNRGAQATLSPQASDMVTAEIEEQNTSSDENWDLQQHDDTSHYSPLTEESSQQEQAEKSPDFAQLYAPVIASLDGLLLTLAKTRSVSSVILVNREGYSIVEQVKDSLGSERLCEFVVEAVSFLEAFAETPQYWVIECAGGIVVVQSIDSYHYLVIIGQAGANFGALRYTMDRIRPNFEQVLQSACPA